MQWYWWLNTKNVSRRMKWGESGCVYRRQASRQLQELARQARQNRKGGEVGLESRYQVDYHYRSVLAYSIATDMTFKDGFY
jgi:hypothetical protein